jgi:hypothetical protein
MPQKMLPEWHCRVFQQPANRDKPEFFTLAYAVSRHALKPGKIDFI